MRLVQALVCGSLAWCLGGLWGAGCTAPAPHGFDASGDDASSARATGAESTSSGHRNRSAAGSTTTRAGTATSTGGSGYDCALLETCCRLLAADPATPPAILQSCEGAAASGGGACAPRLEGFQVMHYCAGVGASSSS